LCGAIRQIEQFQAVPCQSGQWQQANWGFVDLPRLPHTDVTVCHPVAVYTQSFCNVVSKTNAPVFTDKAFFCTVV
jgi:hypothetical protein